MPLASVQKINKVFSIEGADRIEGVEVLGWKCVVRKGQFKEGDLCIYIEIDTIIPKYLLTDNLEDEEEIKLRTVKMKGQISQGLVLPLSIVTGYDDYPPYPINLDVTEILRIKKYEKSITAHLQGLIKGDFPSFLRKTDEVKIQSEPQLLELLKGKPYYITTKLDGTSATYYKFEGKFGVCSRNLEMQDGDNIYWNMARKYNIESWLPEGFAIQGEIVGEGINKNPLGIKGQEFYIFNIIDIKNAQKMDYDTMLGMLAIVPVDLVPVEEAHFIEENLFNYTLEELLEKAKGNYSSGNRKEGIVIRSIDQTISFKVVNNDYLLKDDK